MEPGERVVLHSEPASNPDRFDGSDDRVDILELRAADVLAPSPALPGVAGSGGRRVGARRALSGRRSPLYDERMTEETWQGADLLAGPRGRRLCLELVVELDPDVRAAVHRLSWGSGGVLLRSGDAGPETPREPETGLDDLVAGIARIDPEGIASDAIDRALARSVDTAMYWQEPYGEDVLAAFPEVRAALGPVAVRVADDRGSSWWTRPRRPEQWSIEWHGAPLPAPEVDDPSVVLEGWRAHTLADEERAGRERPSDPAASWSGEWWSSPFGTLMTARILMTTGVLDDGVPAGLRLVEDSLGYQEATAVPVGGVGRTLEIRGVADWAELCRRFPLEVTASRRHDWYRTTGRHGRWVIPDWREAAREWDAVHLTTAGYLSAATVAIPVDSERASVIAGWGPDTTVWLGGPLRRWAAEAVEWRFDRDRDDWVRA